jgi:GxxExxY protein
VYEYTKIKIQPIRNDLIYSDLCYELVGLLFGVWSDLGYGYKEKIYQKAIEQTLVENNFKFNRELAAKISYKNKIIGTYYFDFLIEDKVVLEVKVRNYFSKRNISQLYSCLKAKDLKLGIIAHFTSKGVRCKRVVNLKQLFVYS